MRLGLLGRGRLASAIREAAGESLAWQVTRSAWPQEPVDAVIDASHGDAASHSIDRSAGRGIPLVLATTGWEPGPVAERVSDSVGLLVAPNLSLAMAFFGRLTAAASRFCHDHESRDLFLVERHHARKRDAPSGTALWLAETILRHCPSKRFVATSLTEGGLDSAALSVSSIRAGGQSSSHTLGIEAPGESLRIRHEAHDLSPFGHGALVAAEWIRHRKGLFHFSDLADDLLRDLFLENPP